MHKAIFIGKDDLGEIFKILGLEVVIIKEEKYPSFIEEDKIIFTEPSLYLKIKEMYPKSTIIPLVDFERKTSSVIGYIKEIIRSTVGDEVLKNE